MGDERDRAREPATPHKLKKARARGEVARSREWTGALALLGGLAGAGLGGQETLLRLLQLFSDCLSGGEPAQARVALDLLIAALGWLGGGAAIGALIGGVSQVGLRLVWPRSPGRLNPFAGLRRMVSKERLLDTAWLLLRLLLLCAVALGPLLSGGSPAFGAGSPADARADLGRLTPMWTAALVRLAAASLVLAGLDRWVQKRRFLRRQRMTPEEVTRERREREGDPALRSERRRRHRQALAGGLSAMARARVVVVNPTHAAAALAYDPREDDAPVVLVAGWRQAADRIRERARLLGLPLVEQVPLARALADQPWGEPIPGDLYEAAAALIAALEEAGR